MAILGVYPRPTPRTLAMSGSKCPLIRSTAFLT